jgi:putative aldouronate transport system permease protein
MSLKKLNASFAYSVTIHCVLALFSLLAVVPLVLVFVISITPEKLFWTEGYSLFPKQISFIAYQTVLADPKQLLNSYFVSIFVTTVGTICGLWLTASLGWVVCRQNYALRRPLSFLIFFTMIFQGGIVPSYILVASWLHLKDSLLALILPSMISGFNVYLMRGYLQEIPAEMVESGQMDGASEFTLFTRIIIPMATPALAAVGLILAFVYWNNWVDSSLYIDSNNKIGLQYMLVKVIQQLNFLNSDFARSTLNLGAADIPSDSARMAICILVAGPIMLLFPFFQKYFVKGMTVGAVKG